MSTTPLLDVQDLRVSFRNEDSRVHAVTGSTFQVNPGECVALLGESGSGKSVTAQAIMGILPRESASVDGGSIHFKGSDLLNASEKARVAVRGDEIAMIFQDALSALNPVHKVGTQITEVYRRRRRVSRQEARRKALELMDLVKIPAASRRVDDFPHQLSGGMRQRVMIATSLALDPDLLIADEPTTALDVTVQAEIMELLDEIRRERQMAMILITHDLGVVSDTADRVCVMYAGSIVESGMTRTVFGSPGHPYTDGLLRSIPRMAPPTGLQFSIPGSPPRLDRLPTGCPFRSRCPIAESQCETVFPPNVELTPGHRARCHLAGTTVTTWESR